MNKQQKELLENEIETRLFLINKEGGWDATPKSIVEQSHLDGITKTLRYLGYEYTKNLNDEIKIVKL